MRKWLGHIENCPRRLRQCNRNGNTSWTVSQKVWLAVIWMVIARLGYHNMNGNKRAWWCSDDTIYRLMFCITSGVYIVLHITLCMRVYHLKCHGVHNGVCNEICHTHTAYTLYTSHMHMLETHRSLVCKLCRSLVCLFYSVLYPRVGWKTSVLVISFDGLVRLRRR